MALEPGRRGGPAALCLPVDGLHEGWAGAVPFLGELDLLAEFVSDAEQLVLRAAQLVRFRQVEDMPAAIGGDTPEVPAAVCCPPIASISRASDRTGIGARPRAWCSRLEA